MSNLIVIVGVTGNQGGSVAKTFGKDPAWKIRGITRDPSRPSNKNLVDQGVELVAADLDDTASLEKAFSGANVIFGVTDFWQFMRSPETHKTAAEQGKTINEISYDREVQQGKNVVDAAASVADNLDRFVLSTLSHTKKWSKGRVTGNYHFDAKATFTEYLQEQYPRLNEKTSLLQVGIYMSNWRMGMVKPEKQADGTYEFRYCASTTELIPFVDPPNDTGPFVRALLKAPAGITMLGVSDEMTAPGYIAAWSKATGKKCRYIQITLDEFKSKFAKPYAEEMAASIQAFKDVGYTGGDPAVKLPKDVGVEIADLTTVEQYHRQEDWSSLL